MKKVGVFCLYDRSGSMHSKEREAVDAMNVYFKELPEHYVVTVAAFDSNNPFQLIRNHVKVRDFCPIDLVEDDIKARGGTPLYDSMGTLLNMIDNEVDYFSNIFIIVQTDGEENTSIENTRQSILSRLNRYNKEKVVVLFLGSEFKDVGTVSGSLGVSQFNTINREKGFYACASRGLAEATMNYATGSLLGADTNWAKEVSNFIEKDNKVKN